MIASPDKSGAEYGEIPAVRVSEASGHPLLPPFGDGVAVTAVHIRYLVERRFLVQGSAG